MPGRTGGDLSPIVETPALSGDGAGRLFAPPLTWAGRRRLFLAAPEAWRWMELPAGRWVALRAAREERPGSCVTVPIPLAGALERRLQIDARVGHPRGAVRIEALDAAGQVVAGLTARVARGDGWLNVSWPRGRGLHLLETPAFRLRFTVEPGARLYGFRFVE